MKHLKLYQSFKLNELIAHGQQEDNYGNYALLHREHLWIFDYSTYDDFAEEMCDALELDVNEYEDVDEFLDAILQRDRLSHVVVGVIESPYFVINANRSFRVSRLSPDVKKLMKHLGLSKIRTEHSDLVHGEKEIYGEEEVDSKEKYRNATFYHGTTVSALTNILIKGITPRDLSRAKSNFKNINHYDKIFITLNKEAAYGHSMGSARKNNSFPVVLEVRVPDLSKLELDFDVASIYHREDEITKKLGYTSIIDNGIMNSDTTDSVRNAKNKLGEFAYLGRIPASHIDRILLDSDAYELFVDRIELGDNFDFEEHEESLTHDIDDWKDFTTRNIEEYLNEVDKNKQVYDDEE